MHSARYSVHPSSPTIGQPLLQATKQSGIHSGTFLEFPSLKFPPRWDDILHSPRGGRLSHSYNPRLDNEDVNHHSRQKFGYPAAVCPMGSGRMYEMVRGDGNIWPPRDSVQTTVMANQYSFTFSVFPYVNLISDNLRLQCRLTIRVLQALHDRDIA